jgi:hypothetical protein
MRDYAKLKEQSVNKTTEFAKLKNEHQQEIDRLKKDYEKLLLEKTNQIRELNEKCEKDELDKSTSSASEFSKSSDLGQKLREQVNLTKELDTRLITEFNNKQASKNNNSIETKQLPENIKVFICFIN